MRRRPRAGARPTTLVTARAVGRLSTLAELASPLLAEGGALVAWKGRRDAGEEAELERAAERLAMEPEEIRWVGPYAGSRNRHLHLLRKIGPDAGGPAAPGRDGEEAAVRRPPNAAVCGEPARAEHSTPPRRRARSVAQMGAVYAIANQKGGVGKTTTAVNLAACVAAGGRQTLLVDLDAQCNATVALGLDRDLSPSSLRVPGRRELGRRGGAAGGPRQPLDRPREPRPRRRRGRAAADRRLRAPPARGPRPGPRALRADPARLPALARPGHRQRARRGRPGDRPGPGRVPRARGPGPVPRDARPDPARASTRAWF